MFGRKQTLFGKKVKKITPSIQITFALYLSFTGVGLYFTFVSINHLTHT